MTDQEKGLCNTFRFIETILENMVVNRLRQLNKHNLFTS